jgi:hypothetical protein
MKEHWACRNDDVHDPLDYAFLRGIHETFAKTNLHNFLRTEVKNLAEIRGMVLLGVTINRLNKKARDQIQPGTIFYTEVSKDCHGDGSIDVPWSPECGGARISLAEQSLSIESR